MIRKLGKKYRVVSHKGKNLGTYTTKKEATERLRQIENFKRRQKSDNWRLRM